MTNRLAQAQSLYLRKHGENPIDWWPWCDEAIARARQENRPIFLSVGYSSCHWCTVMEGEAFSDPAIAAYLNAQFVPIKVDREERPDLDSIYMQALQLMTGQGGWPLNIFLAPDDLVPFYGGTYFPVDPKYGRPGFLQVLQALRRFYDTNRDQLSAIKTEMLEHLQASTTLAASETLNSVDLIQGFASSARLLRPLQAGNCFPMMPHGEAALRGSRFDLTDDDGVTVAQRCYQRGMSLALGGILDHVAGGWHRYTVDATWTVPHFEKMLYDNGQIVAYLAQLWAQGHREPAIARAIAQTVQWLQREMTAPEGFFYAAQDADSFIEPAAPEPEEGAFYVWAYDEVATLLSPDDLAALADQFTLTPPGNFEGQNVLQRRTADPLSPGAIAALEQLFAQRYGQPPATLQRFAPARDNGEARQTPWPGRIPPVTDTKLIVAWNSLMVSGLAQAAIALEQPNYRAIADRAMAYMLEHQWRSPQLYRLNYGGVATVPAQAEDYALMIQALLDLHQATLADPPAIASADLLLQQAQALQAAFDDQLWAASGGYHNTRPQPDVLIQERSYQDNATPAANGIAFSNLVRLALLTGNLAYLDRAEQGLQAFTAVMTQIPRACPSLFGALDWFRHGTLVQVRPQDVPPLLTESAPTAVFKATSDLPEGVVGLVCEGLFCKAPANTWEQLHSQLQASQRRSPHPSTLPHLNVSVDGPSTDAHPQRSR
jgi:uncharacterized protein YyaL (SSP411 family)